jgi:tRNA pseudouridine38-40 synthase
MKVYKLLIEYDGTNLQGWQIQRGQDAACSIQGLVESALEVVLKSRPSVVGSGRTDAGVHARGQVAHFELDWSVEPSRLMASLNGLLPRSVRIIELSEARNGFHARYDAVRRTYHYYVSTEPRALDASWRLFLRPAPDFDLMNEAARSLLGEHDFSAFCRTKSDTRNRICRVYSAAWFEQTRAGDWYFAVSADRFLHGMVRAMVGTLIEIGRGKRPPEEIPAILASRNNPGQIACLLGFGQCTADSRSCGVL